MHQQRSYGSFWLKGKIGGGNTPPSSASRVLLVGVKTKEALLKNNEAL